MNAPMIERRKGGFMLRHNPLLVDKLVRIKREREGEIVARPAGFWGGLGDE